MHGDAHLGNIMWHHGEMKLIDFDMTAVGPAGMDLAYLVLMLFRCGFSLEAVASLEAQRTFAHGYLGHDSKDCDVESFLFDMHCWAYVGLIQMGLLSAVLMHKEGQPAKRELMLKRAPELLSPTFLAKSKDFLLAARADEALKSRLLREGLFFACQ